MAQITSLAKVLNGLVRNYDFTGDELVFDSVRYGGLAGTLLTKTILDSLIANSHASGSDNQNIVAGDGLTGGGSGATVTLNIGAGSGISVAADAVAVDSTVIRTNGANAFSADQSMGGNKLTNVGTPTASGDAANKLYVDSLSAGLDPKASVRAATTAALPAVTYNNGTGGVGATLTADANGALAAQDGVTLVVSDRLLVKNQASALQNGIYTVTQVGDGSNPFILTRATDQDGSPASEVSGGNHTFVEQGTSLQGTGWVVVWNGNVTVGTDAINWTQFSDTGSPVTSVNGQTGVVVLNTSHISENTNLYFTDERAQDAIGAMVANSSKVSLTYVDGTPSLTADIVAGSLVNADISASAAIAYSKLNLSGSIVNADISASAAIAYSKLNLSNSIVAGDLTSQSVTAAKINTDVFDQSTITGGNGSAAAVAYSPLTKKSMVAGEAFAANTSFLVRFALTGETAGRVYKATSASAVADGKFWAIGVATGTGQVAGDPINVVIIGTHTLGSSDTAFGAGDVGKAVWLTTAGGFSVTAPSSSGDAAFRIGSVEATNKIFVDGKQLTGIS